MFSTKLSNSFDCGECMVLVIMCRPNSGIIPLGARVCIYHTLVELSSFSLFTWRTKQSPECCLRRSLLWLLRKELFLDKLLHIRYVKPHLTNCIPPPLMSCYATVRSKLLNYVRPSS